MAAYQHRDWDAALDRFGRLKALQPTRPGLDALLDEVRWFRELEAAAPRPAPLDAGPQTRPVGPARRRLERWQATGLAFLGLVGLVALLLTAFPDRRPWSTAPGAGTQDLLDRGQASLNVGDYEGAEAAFQKLLEQVPDDPEALLGITRARRLRTLAEGYAAADAAIADEDWERAGSELDGILAIDPTYSDARAKAGFVAERRRLASLYQDGSRLYDLGQWPDAIAQFERVRELEPAYRTEAVREFLFVSYLNSGNQIIEQGPADPPSVQFALDQYTQALAIHPRNRLASDAFRLGSIYLEATRALAAGQPDESQAILQGLLAEAPRYAGGRAAQLVYETAVARADEALAAGDIPRAVEGYREAQSVPVFDRSRAEAGESTALSITPSPTPRPTPTRTLTPRPTPFGVTQAGGLNVRSGPGTSFPAIGRLAPGTLVAVAGREPRGEWLQICCVNGRSGWVTAAGVRLSNPGASLAVIEPPPTPTPPPTPRPTPTETPVLDVCIQGRVRDAAGGAGLRDWNITLIGSTGEVRSQRSNRTGYYRFSDLGPGDYSVKLEVPGGWRPLSPTETVATAAPGKVCTYVDFWNERLPEQPPPPPPPTATPPR
jgi:tetratricopeptide (TPR) repeat protein